MTTKVQLEQALIERSAFVCPGCHGVLNWQAETAHCPACAFLFSVRGGQPDFRPDLPSAVQEHRALDETESFQNKLKLFLRQSPLFYRFLVLVIGPALLLGPTSQRFVDDLGQSKKVLNIGAGVMRLKGNVTHLDYEPYKHLEVVGDAHHLPFADNTFDGVVCETMLEHVLEPERVISEMRRVLKPGGKIYIMMPFMYGFHAAPNDYQRWSHKGLQYRMRDFINGETHVVAGPTSALSNILIEWCALAFSFGSRRLYRLLALVFLVALSPLKLLDFLMTRHPEAIRIASIFLFVGEKPSEAS